MKACIEVGRIPDMVEMCSYQVCQYVWFKNKHDVGSGFVVSPAVCLLVVQVLFEGLRPVSAWDQGA